MARIDLLARFRIGHEAIIGMLMLKVEQPGKPARRPGEGRMVDDIRHPFGPKPYFAFPPQAFQKLLACSCSHGAAPSLFPAAPP
jgi:hypothetical protein